MLYPPIIEGVLPPFVLDKNMNKIKLTIPYKLSRGVNPNNIGGLALYIKSIPLNNLIYNSVIEISINENDNFNVATFEFTSKNLFIGEYYKIQLAFIEKGKIEGEIGQIGYLSTASIIKYTATPSLTIENSGKNIAGTFFSLDPTETLYSSRFRIFDSYDNMIEDSGEIKATKDNTDNNKCLELYTIKSNLQTGYSYKIRWDIITSNNLTAYIEKEDIFSFEVLEPDYVLIPWVQTDYENGLLNIGVKGYDNGEEIDLTLLTDLINFGDYSLYRASRSNDFKDWQFLTTLKTITNTELSQQNNFKTLIQDYNIQQGESYKYKLSQVNNKGINAIGFFSNIITADFDAMFLCDEERSLKISFNPKISTFKDTIKENKIETLGSKFPFFFRNEDIRYKEFNISGLISRLMDQGNTFKIDSFINNYETNLTSSNIYKERLFKEEVLNWLNNGKTKLLKTATEGNYYVRLMGVSLSPNDTLGRMLHSFSAQAYEVEETFEILIHDLRKIVDEYKIETLPLIDVKTKYELENSLNLKFKELIISEEYAVNPLNIQINYNENSEPKTMRYNISNVGYYLTIPESWQVTSIIFTKDSTDNYIIELYTLLSTIEEEGKNQFRNITEIPEYNGDKISNVITDEESGFSLYNNFYYYKYAQFVNATQSKENNVVTYIDTTGQKKEITIIDQLRIEDQYLKIMDLDNTTIELQYCISLYNE